MRMPGDEAAECPLLTPPLEGSFAGGWEDLARKSVYRRWRLARLLQVSVRTLDRYFQQHRAMSAARWLARLQLADAYEQVLDGKPLKEISFNAGFKQPSHFSRRFKARFGICPSLLRGAVDSGENQQLAAGGPRRARAVSLRRGQANVHLPEAAPTNTRLYVSNLAANSTTETVRAIFAIHGSVSDVQLLQEPVPNPLRAFAFVVMETHEGARKAMEMLHQTVAEGCSINVHEAKSQLLNRALARARTPRREFRKLY